MPIVFRFARPHYVSDATNFIDSLKLERPELEQKQQAGRSLLWDKPPKSPDQIARERSAKVPQQPYVYHGPLRPGSNV